LIELGDAVIAVKQPNGHVKLNQLFNPAAIGALSGTFWGALIGMIFLMPLAGAAIGAASGALGGALTDVEINNEFIKNAAQHLQSGNAALFVLIRKMTTGKVLAALQGEGGTVVRTSFDERGRGLRRRARRCRHVGRSTGRSPRPVGQPQYFPAQEQDDPDDRDRHSIRQHHRDNRSDARPFIVALREDDD